eukprot:2566184-Pyramimonas_sp.AAC.1
MLRHWALQILTAPRFVVARFCGNHTLNREGRKFCCMLKAPGNPIDMLWGLCFQGCGAFVQPRGIGTKVLEPYGFTILELGVLVV